MIKILWINDVVNWAYENRFNVIKAFSQFDHVQVLTSGLHDSIIIDMIEMHEPDLIIAGNPRCYRLVKNWRKAVLILAGNRPLKGWAR